MRVEGKNLRNFRNLRVKDPEPRPEDNTYRASTTDLGCQGARASILGDIASRVEFRASDSRERVVVLSVETATCRSSRFGRRGSLRNGNSGGGEARVPSTSAFGDAGVPGPPLKPAGAGA